MLRYNKVISQNEWIQAGKLLSNPEEEAVLTTKKKDKEGNLLGEDAQKDFRLVDVEITYDDGTKDTVQSTIWEKQIEAGIFKQGDDIQIAIQTEGDYAGRSKVELPSNKKLRNIEEDNPDSKIKSHAKLELKEENQNLSQEKEKGSGGCIAVAVIGIFLLLGPFIPAFIRGGGDIESGFKGVQDSVFAGSIIALVAFIGYFAYQIGKGSK
jgi:hypothetical protein